MGTKKVRKYKGIPLTLLDPLGKSQLDEVVKAIKAAPDRGKLDVRGVMGLQEDVAKFDRITFDNQAVLMLEAMDSKFVALATKELILDIKNPQYRAYLSRPIGRLETDILKTIRGKDGSAGADGRRGADGGNGQDGGHGGPGGNATSGVTKQMPPIFFFVQAFKFGEDATPAKQYFNLNFNGFPGGDGGTGGRGGHGGGGGNGHNGVPSLVDCMSGAGNGGNGGNAGTGGRGGDAANGGNGALLYLLAPDASIFDFTTGNIEGGPPGRLGIGGNPGTPGNGGNGGAAVGWCLNSGSSGRRGKSANPPSEGDGRPAIAGARGSQIVNSRDNSDLF